MLTNLLFAHNKCMKSFNGKIIPIQQIVLPNKTNYIIDDTDSVKLLLEITEDLNYTKLYETYSTIGRNPAITPETLFRIIVYGYMEGIYSSRKLEKACKRDINFMFLLQGQKAPEHNTINRFRGERLITCIQDLFNQLISKLAERKEIRFNNIYIDGTKIEANANRYSFVWKGSIDKFSTKLNKKILDIVPEIIERHDIYLSLDLKVLDSLNELYEKLKELINEAELILVSGKGKRKSQLQKDLEMVFEFKTKFKKYEDYKKILKTRNSFSKTDKDATFMRMKEDHMRNGQLKPAYNVQIGVEGEFIVGVDISDERSDQRTFIPFLTKINNNFSEKFKNIVADAGYESEENYEFLKVTEQIAYIKPLNYEQSKRRKYKKNIGKRENMSYNAEKDFYTCHNNKILKVIGNTKRKSKFGYISDVTIYECESCSDCIHKNECTKAKENKKLYVSKNFIEKRKESLNNISTLCGKEKRMNRSIQVEGAFAQIKWNYDFKRFLLRSNTKVLTEMLLLCFGHNIKKLYNKLRKNKSGVNIHLMNIS